MLSIFDLNYDCLLHLLSFLSVNDLIKFGVICDTLDHIIIKRLSKETVDYSKLRHRLTFEETKKILDIFGCHIKNLTLIEWILPANVDFFWLLATYCSDINNLTLSYPSQTGLLIYKKILSKCKHIEKLKITTRNLGSGNDIPGMSLVDELSISINKLTNLRGLSVANLPKFTGYHLHSLRNLKDLDIQNCIHFGPTCLKRILTVNKLQTLKVSGSHALDYPTINKLIETQSELKTLLCICKPFSNLGRIAWLDSLKDFTITTCFIDDLVDNFVKRERHTDLEAFRVILLHSRHDCFASPEKLFLFVNLRVLHLIGMEPLRNNFLTTLGAKLQNLEELKIRFRAYEAPIKCDGIEEFLKNSRSLKKLTLHSSDIRISVTELFRIDGVRYSKGYRKLSVCFCAMFRNCVQMFGHWKNIKAIKTIKFKCEPIRQVPKRDEHP